MSLRFGFMITGKPIEKEFANAKRSGISHIEIDLMEEHSFIESFDDKRADKIRLLAKQHRISLSLHVPYTLNLAEFLPSIRKSNIDYMKRSIILAHKLEATHITTHIGYCNMMLSQPWLKKEATDRLISSLKEILQYCKRYKVCLALENVNPMPDDSEFFYIGDNIKELKRLYKAINSQYLKMCLDVGHAHTNEGVAEYIKAFKSKIVAVHYHDNHGKYDEHLAMGDGTIDWERTAKEFKKIRFEGPFISEIYSKTVKESKEDLEHYFL
ncbi:sugar phosphate isomerase/epimerase [Candidatus Woesearchaeota archaeon]|nr:sugar phosphate isomerase/epimerase [Candidatus Woesearchaeota archaeon]